MRRIDFQNKGLLGLLATLKLRKAPPTLGIESSFYLMNNRLANYIGGCKLSGMIEVGFLYLSRILYLTKICNS